MLKAFPFVHSEQQSSSLSPPDMKRREAFSPGDQNPYNGITTHLPTKEAIRTVYAVFHQTVQQELEVLIPSVDTMYVARNQTLLR